MEEAPRLAVDRMLGRLARWLRIMGADAAHDPSLPAAAIARLAQREGRRLITRDKRLRTFPNAIFIESNNFRAQLKQVCGKLALDRLDRAFSRCAYCNEPLSVISREFMVRRVPPFVYAAHERFTECERCGRIYWAATHQQRILKELEALGLGQGKCAGRQSD